MFTAINRPGVPFFVVNDHNSLLICIKGEINGKLHYRTSSTIFTDNPIFTGLTGAELKSHQFKLSILKQWPKLIKRFPSQ